MNYIWGGMLLLGIVYGIVTGNGKEVTDAILHSSEEALHLCLSMAGIMAFWTGILKVAERAGLLTQLAEKISPLLRFLFPNLPPGHPAERLIATNLLAKD